MDSQNHVLQKCFKDASLACGPALERCIDYAIATLQDAETKSMKARERDDLAIAWRELLKLKPNWLAQFPRDVLVAFNTPTNTAKASAASLSGTAASAAASGKFSLVDDTRVVQDIESARMLQRVLPVVEQVLAELDALMSTAQGLSNVTPELNPVRPQVFAQAVRRLIDESPVEADVRVMWARYIGEKLGRELRQIYEGLVQTLVSANVQSASYRVLQTPASVTAARSQAHKAAIPAPGGPPGGLRGDGLPDPEQYVDLSNYEINDALFQDFLYHGGSNEQHGLAPSYYASVDEDLSRLRAEPDMEPQAWESGGPVAADYLQMPVVDRPAKFVDVLSQLNAQVWGSCSTARQRSMVRTQLKKEAKRVGQVLGLEVVRKLVNQVAQDPRLLVPVRESIVALEPSLLRLAMIDPRFFSDERHPGRRLMERVAERSFKYNDEFSPEFEAFFAPVVKSVVELNGRSIEDVRPFESALAALESLWLGQDSAVAGQQQEMLQTMQFAEERQAKADQIAWDMSSRSDLDQVPAVVLDFLYSPWALAMAHARMTSKNAAIDPSGLGSVVTDLLWSVKRDFTLRQPAKLVEMIPPLLRELHAGLALLGRDPREDEAFFIALMWLHQPALRLRRAKSKRDALEIEPGAMPLDVQAGAAPATAEERKAKAAAFPWLGRQDLVMAGFEDTLPIALSELAGEDVDTVHAAADCAESAAGPVSDFAAVGLPAAVVGLEAPSDAAIETPAASADGVGTEPALAVGPTPAEVLAVLTAGSWADLYSRQRWLRAQLVWASTKGTLFMFVSHGGQPHSMTRRSCERLIRERLLRPVDAHSVVANALDAVARDAVAGAAGAAGGADLSGHASRSMASGGDSRNQRPARPFTPRHSPGLGHASLSA
ncbi:MAG: DUF1631 family protein [Bdellovibrionales bacterium]|nr:DUF1631 family protein [Ramlibacter sp.]